MVNTHETRSTVVRPEAATASKRPKNQQHTPHPTQHESLTLATTPQPCLFALQLGSPLEHCIVNCSCLAGREEAVYSSRLLVVRGVL